MNRKVLAAGPVTRIEICPCGSCYLTIGPITMALQLGVLKELGDVVARAMRALRAGAGPDPRAVCQDTQPAGKPPEPDEGEETPAALDADLPFAN